MCNRIYSFYCKHKLINTSQCGFWCKHSTGNALGSLIETIKKYWEMMVKWFGVFIDLQKSFDTVNHKILYLFRSFLSKRKEYELIEGFFSQTKFVKYGVLQGSTLGPLLFVIHLNDLTNALEKFILLYFAGDTNLFYDSQDPSVISDVTDGELKLATDRLRANKLPLNEFKPTITFKTYQETEFNIA